MNVVPAADPLKTGGEVEVGATDSVVRNNLFQGSSLNIRSPTTGPSVLGNHFYGHSGDQGLVRAEDTGDGSPILFAYNYAQRNGTTRQNTPIFRFKTKNGLMLGNAFGTIGDSGYAKPGVKIEGDRWLVSNNYFRSPQADNSNGTLEMSGGRVANNIFEGTEPLVIFDDGKTPVVEGNTYIGSKPEIKGSPANFKVGEPRTATYTGDGTEDRFIQTFSNPEKVIVRDSSGTLYDVHAAFGTGFEYNSPSGELSIVEGGFKVGDNDSDADPNISGEVYTFYAR